MVNRTIPFLFLSLAVLQLLDMHSTLAAPQGRAEQNNFIAWLANNLGMELAVFLIKMLDLMVIGLFYGVWKKSHGIFNKQFFVCLSLIVAAYVLVVTSNYSG
ncbi:MAG: hypothetical protein IT497_03520 [Ottowia sp.]|jgi:hypothetical protein|nr:hypothetical protein [Ottowia sp.]